MHPLVGGDRRPPDRHEAPVADQAIEHDTRDDAPARMAEGREAERETGLDGASASGKQRNHGDDLRDRVGGDQCAERHVRADRAERGVEGEAVEQPVRRRERGHAEVIHRTDGAPGEERRREHRHPGEDRQPGGSGDGARLGDPGSRRDEACKRGDAHERDHDQHVRRLPAIGAVGPQGPVPVDRRRSGSGRDRRGERDAGERRPEQRAHRRRDADAREQALDHQPVGGERERLDHDRDHEETGVDVPERVQRARQELVGGDAQREERPGGDGRERAREPQRAGRDPRVQAPAGGRRTSPARPVARASRCVLYTRHGRTRTRRDAVECGR